MNRTSFVLKYLKLHACMHIIAKMHFYISLLVTCIIITCWTLLKVTEEKFKINSFLGSIFLHLHMHNSPFWFLYSIFVNYLTNSNHLIDYSRPRNPWNNDLKTSQFHPIRAHYRAMRIKWGINTYWIWPLLHQRPKIWTKNREIHSLEWYHWNCPLSGQLCLAGYTQCSVPGELNHRY